MNPLIDKDFLRLLDQQKEREIFARVVSLSFQEEPLEEITGRVTQGSVNVDGNSAVRRTCSVSLVAEELNIHDYYWGLNTKFKLYVGLKNNIQPKYPDIIWYPQGTFLISTFNTSQSTNSYTISLQGKDKMCMLNGEIGGTVTALSVDFGQVDRIQEDGSIRTEKYLLKDIIRDAVHTYAQEPYQNIIINDLDEAGAELMEYRGEEPMYFLVDCATHEVTNMTMDGSQKYYYRNYNKNTNQYNGWSYTQMRLDSPAMVYDTRTNYLDVDTFPTYIQTRKDDGTVLNEYTVIRATEGDAIGYRLTGLTYAGDLVIQAGGTVTQMLDKIKSMLGDFEYFYDLQGHFVFQRKRTFVNRSWNNIVQNTEHETYVDPVALTSGLSYSFENSNIVTTFSNAPNLANLRNDFSIWGSRKSVTGQDIPIHLRYAIDKKPTYYKTYSGEIYTTMDIEQVIPIPDRSRLPEVLKEGFEGEWWDIHDWAELYKGMTGSYPNGAMGGYGNRTCKIDLNAYFPPQPYTWDKNDPLFLFDITPEDGLYSAVHNPWADGIHPSQSCGHLYSWFIERSNKEGIRSFIYDPTIPSTVKILYNKVDWREIIYQMALDYMEHQGEDDFLLRVAENNIDVHTKESYYPMGYTGYEPYYTDILGFWRTLYNPTYLNSYETVFLTKSKFEANKIKYYEPVPFTKDERFNKNKQYIKKVVFGSYEPVTLTEENFNSIQDTSIFYWLKQCTPTTEFNAKQIYFVKVTGEYDPETFWHMTVLESPELLNFWFDFLDARDGQLASYAVYNVGNRPKSENDSDVKAIYFRDTPNVIFVDSTISDSEMAGMHEQKPGYTFIKLPTVMENLFTISAQGKSAFDKLNTHLYNHAYCTESITLNALPIYYLEPNTRIFVKDGNSGIEGEYIINRISIPLQYQGTMSISATKVVERLY
jgi:hypothetical protein